ncbi:hypothetical protein ACN28S_49115 [Cystobacter fuscus]
MADEKRGKGSGSGPFELGRCYEVDARLGRLHEARNVATGTPALTLVPSDDVEWQPGGPCRMSLVYDPERDSVTVDVEQAPVSVRTSALTNLLVLMSAAFKRVEDDDEVDAHLASGPVRRLGPEGAHVRRGWPSMSWLTAAGVTVLTAVLGVWFCSTRVSKVPAPDEFGVAVESPSQGEMSFVGRGKSPTAVAYPLPSKPVPKQAVAPCEADNGEVEINKGCWVELAKKPPCGPKQAEYQGKCYLPVRKEDPLPQSVKP